MAALHRQGGGCHPEVPGAPGSRPARTGDRSPLSHMTWTNDPPQTLGSTGTADLDIGP
jgi:hypothetical protein